MNYDLALISQHDILFNRSNEGGRIHCRLQNVSDGIRESPRCQISGHARDSGGAFYGLSTRSLCCAARFRRCGRQRGVKLDNVSGSSRERELHWAVGAGGGDTGNKIKFRNRFSMRLWTADRQAGRQTGRRTDGGTDGWTSGWASWLAGRQAGRQAGSNLKSIQYSFLSPYNISSPSAPTASRGGGRRRRREENTGLSARLCSDGTAWRGAAPPGGGRSRWQGRERVFLIPPARDRLDAGKEEQFQIHPPTHPSTALNKEETPHR